MLLDLWQALSALQEGPKPYSRLPNKQRGSSSWKQSTRRSQLEGKPTVQLNRALGFPDSWDLDRIFTRFCTKSGEQLLEAFHSKPIWSGLRIWELLTCQGVVRAICRPFALNAGRTGTKIGKT